MFTVTLVRNDDRVFEHRFQNYYCALAYADNEATKPEYSKVLVFNEKAFLIYDAKKEMNYINSKVKS